MGKKRKNKARSKVHAAAQAKPVIKQKSGNMKWILIGVAAVIIIAIGFSASTGGSDYPSIITERPTIGNEDAPVLLEEFTDLQCPACRQAHPLLKTILSEYPEDVKLQYYHFPLTRIHPLAFNAHIGAECANDQGMLPEFIDKVYENQQNMARNDLIKYATELGMDESFAECLKSDTKDKIIRSDMAEGLTREVGGTPTFFVNGKQVQTSLEAIRSAIEAELVK